MSADSSVVGDRGRRADVQGLRAIAVLLVVAYHAGLPLSGGFVGVDVFFVISGFVIARLLLAELEDTGCVNLGRFYARRVRRLVPALALLVISVALMGSLLLNPFGPQDASAETGIAVSVFGANIELFRAPAGYFDLGAETNALLHTWSLSVEEQFYFVFPACLVLAWRLGHGVRFRGRVACAIVLSLIAGASFALSYWTGHGHGDRLAHALGGGIAKFAFYMPMTRGWEFCAGVLVAIAAFQLAKMPRALADVLGVLGIAAIMFGAIRITRSDVFPGSVTLFPVVGTTLAIAAGCVRGSLVARLLGNRPLVAIGDVSYGWYLWHWPLIVFARAVWPGHVEVTLGAAIVSLLPTMLSYRYLENRIRFDERIAGWRAVALVLVCGALSISACFVLRSIASAERSHASTFIAALEHHDDYKRGCAKGPRIGDPACTWPSASTRGMVVLVGDSNAGQFTEAVASAAQASGRPFSVATDHGCAFAELRTSSNGRERVECLRFVTDTVAALVAAKPALVVIASAGSYYVRSDEIWLTDPTGEVARTTSEKSRKWTTGLRSVVATLDRAGIATVVVHTIPHLDGFSLATCPYARILFDEAGCGISASRSAIEAQQQAARDAENRAVAGLSHSVTIDFTSDLCTREECSAWSQGAWVYRDDSHLTVQTSRSLASRFAAALARAR